MLRRDLSTIHFFNFSRKLDSLKNRVNALNDAYYAREDARFKEMAGSGGSQASDTFKKARLIEGAELGGSQASAKPAFEALATQVGATRQQASDVVQRYTSLETWTLSLVHIVEKVNLDLPNDGLSEQDIDDAVLLSTRVSFEAQTLPPPSHFAESADTLSTLLGIAFAEASRVFGATSAAKLPSYVSIFSEAAIQRIHSVGSYRINLASETPYILSAVNPASLRIATYLVPASVDGAAVAIPPLIFLPSSAPDTDGDYLPDDVELVVGTNPGNPDTNGDGVSDSAEVQQRTDPLSGLIVQTGVVASTPTSGLAIDVSALNNIAGVAMGTQGVAIFNVLSRQNPVRLAQIDTPGYAQAVAITATRIAVADNVSGLSVIDIADPSNAALIGSYNLGATANAVAVSGSLAYVGLANGQVVVFDMDAKVEVGRVNLPGSAVHDLGISGGILYALTVDQFHAIPLSAETLAVASSAPAPGIVPTLRRRLFVGGGFAYATHARGYTIFQVNSVGGIQTIRDVTDAQFGWKQIVLNGSGLALAATGPNLSDDGLHDVSLYNLPANGSAGSFITTFPTPGLAQAVAIFNGLGYVGDGANGLSVVNYIAYDNKQVAPTISLSTSFVGGAGGELRVEEGKFTNVIAAATDDVQVRNVEFYIDGERVVTDGNFPFEHAFVTPLRTATKTTFTLRVKATDTGGNSTWTNELTVALVADALAPRLVKFLPATGAFAGGIHAVAATFSEPMDPATLTAASFELVGSGPDGRFGTADDFTPAGGVLSYRDATNTAFLTFPQDLPASLYRLRVKPPLADLAGNVIAPSAESQFQAFSFADSDNDGIPDDIETLLGLDPYNPDSNRNGIRDGSEDFDGDGLPNAFEIAYGFNPTKRDTDNNGVEDGVEDPDFDGLNNSAEAFRGTNPFNADTDGDGFDDATEIAEGTSPLTPGVSLRIFSGLVSYRNTVPSLSAPVAPPPPASQP